MPLLRELENTTKICRQLLPWGLWSIAGSRQSRDRRDTNRSRMSTDIINLDSRRPWKLRLPDDAWPLAPSSFVARVPIDDRGTTVRLDIRNRAVVVQARLVNDFVRCGFTHAGIDPRVLENPRWPKF